MIAAANTGPTPFNVSNVASSAVLMLTSVVGAPGTPPVTGGPLGGAAPFFGTRICWPSARGAARLSSVRSAFSSAPPARSTASITRSPGANSKTPGFRTAPATSTINEAAAVTDGEAEPDATTTAGTPGDGPNDGIATGAADPAVVATSTGRGNDRVYQSPTPASNATTTTIRPTSSPRESPSRRSRMSMARRYGRTTAPVVRRVTSMERTAQSRTTRLTSFGARTIVFTTSRPSSAFATRSLARAVASASASEIPTDTSILSRTLPFTCTTIVTVSSAARAGS